ncbi:MAG: Gfo/Idh/MocA family oxidoreductase [Candidatus Delongbacteria bacterium]
MKIGIAGLGYWGPNLVRNFQAQPGCDVHMTDLDDGRRAAGARRFPAAQLAGSYDELLERVEAVALATPLSSHFELGRRALEAGRHLLVEKPFVESAAQARELITLAESKGLTLMVDHTFLYTGAVRKVRELIDQGELGRLLYFDSVRVNLGLFQHDTNVIWDLAPHDLSICDHLAGGEPLAVQACGARHYYQHEDLAYLTVFYPDQLIAHFHVNWIAPVKVRRILIGGDRQMVVYDDMEPSEKIKVYDKGVELTQPEEIWRTLVSYRTGDMRAPRLDGTEALDRMVKEFLDCAATGREPLSGPAHALRVTRLLEAAELSLRQGGRRVELSELA